MPAQPATLRSWRGRRILLLLCAVALLDFIDASITNVALPLGLAIFSAVGAARISQLLAAGTPVRTATTSGLRHALATGAAFAAAAAVLAPATKNTREDPAHPAGTEQDQPQDAAGRGTPMEIR
jgi:hypothetical protein